MGVYSIEDDGSLIWKAAYETGGTGYPLQPDSDRTAWTGANCISYHTWNNKQWLLVSNMGGDNMEPSMSIFVIAEDLTLTRTDVVDVIPGTWAESVTGYENRACILGTGGTVLAECYTISEEGKLNKAWGYDLDVPMVLESVFRGHSDAPSIQFSPDGTKLGLLFKGSVDALFPFSRTPSANQPAVLADGGFYSFAVLEGGTYGAPQIAVIDPFARPYDFVWSPTSKQVWTVGLPPGIPPNIVFPTYNIGNVLLIDVPDDGPPFEAGYYPYAFKAGCWIEYYKGTLYLSNFVVNNDLTVLETDATGAVVDLTVTPPVHIDFGATSAPVDIAISGAKFSGQQYLYLELAGDAEIASMKINDDGSLTEVGRYDIATSDGTVWKFNAGAAATLLSEHELTELYVLDIPVPSGEFLFTNDLVTGTYEEICSFSTAGAGSMKLNIEMSDVGCQTRTIVHYAEGPENGCTGDPIINHESDRLLYYVPGVQPWNATAIAIRDVYKPLNDAGVAVMKAICPVADWKINVGKDAFDEGCNLAQLVFNYFPADCRTFAILASFDEANQLIFRSGTGTERCSFETRTSDLSAAGTSLQWISPDTTDPRTCDKMVLTPAPTPATGDTPAPTPAPTPAAGDTPASTPEPSAQPSSASVMSTFAAFAATLMVLLL